MKPTIGLAIITKEVDETLKLKVQELLPYFDGIYIQENGSVKSPPIGDPKLHFSHFKWNDSFADARNALHKEIDTDYWVWMDTDDDIKGLENLDGVIADMKRSDIDIMFAPYHYEVVDGRTVVLQYRERIVRTDLAGEWKGRIHETFVPEKLVSYNKTTAVQWFHDKSPADYKASKARNLKILEEEAAKTDVDARDLHYLTLAYLGEERWDDVIKTGLDYIRIGGWDEEIYRTWLLIAKAELELGNHEKAVAAAMGATRLLPEYPDAYYYLQEVYYAMGEFKHSLAWYKVASSKEVPESNNPMDPTVRLFRANFSAAMSYSMLGKVEEAFELMVKVGKVAPGASEYREFWPDIREMYYEAEAIKRIEWLASYLSDNGGDPDKLYGALTPAIQSYPQVIGMLKQYSPPKTWPERSIAFFCGPGLEQWGPDTLDQGMGGSEEAITYLSREMAKLGWDVTVFNERKAYYEDGGQDFEFPAGVSYLPWQDFNPNDTFDVVVAWRNPQLFRQTKLKARVRAVDMHDMPVGHQAIKPEDLDFIDKVMFKSRFQRDWLDFIPDEKAEIVSNGIVKEQFNV